MRDPVLHPPGSSGAPGGPPLAQFVFLSLCLHALLISLFGAPAGGAAGGQAFWGGFRAVLVPAATPVAEPAAEEHRSPRELPGATLLGKLDRPRPAAPSPGRTAVPPAAPSQAPPAVVAPVVPVAPVSVPATLPAADEPSPADRRPVTLQRAPEVSPAPVPEPVPVPPVPANLMEPIALPRLREELARPVPAPVLPPARPARPAPEALRPLDAPALPVPPTPAPAASQLLSAPALEPIAPTRKDVPASPSAAPRDAPAPPVDRAAPAATGPDTGRATPVPDTRTRRSPVEQKAGSTPSAAPGAAADQPGDVFRPRAAPAPGAAVDGKPRIDLEAARRRAQELGREGAGNRSLLPFPMPAPPERKSKEAQALEKSLKPECKDAYKGMGLAAIVPLIANEFGEGNCRW